jgi:hypothetical protein
MSFRQAIENQRRPAKRPATLPELLIHIIAPNPEDAAAVMDSDWSAEHVGVPRFRIGGMRWFRDVTKLNGEDILRFREPALALAVKCRWTEMAGVTRAMAAKQEINWKSVSRQQFFDGVAGRPLLLVRAAQVLLACELALQDLIDNREISAVARTDGRPEELAEFVSSQQIYQHMALIPSCWNLSGFNESYLNTRLEADPAFLDNLAFATQQMDHSVFQQLAIGHTITYSLAKKIKEFCDARKSVGQIRCRKGNDKKIGKKRAVFLEEIAS